MLDVKKNCAAVIGRVMLTGFCIQIILGIFWMCNAFAGMKNFGEGIVCVGQIILLGGALWFVIPAETAKAKVFPVLAVESFPMVLQVLMKPDLRIVMAVLLLLGVKLCRRRTIWLWVVVVLGIAVGYVTAPERDLQASMCSRLVWTTLGQDYEELAERVKEKIDYEVMADSTYEAAGIEKIMIPDLRARYTEEEVREVVNALIRIAWRDHKGQIVKEIMWDAAGHIVPPLVVPMQLEHRAYDSYTGLYYRQFLQPAPKMGKYAMRYGNMWFPAAVILRCLLFLTEPKRKMHSAVLWYTALTCAALSGWYTFCCTGRMDYRNAIYIICLWFIWITDGAAVWQKEAVSDVAAEEK